MKARPLFLALILALGCVALGDHHDHDRDHDHGDDHDHDHQDDHREDFYRITRRLDKLTSRIQIIRDRIHQRTDPELIQQGRSLQARVQKLEGKQYTLTSTPPLVPGPLRTLFKRRFTNTRFD